MSKGEETEKVSKDCVHSREKKRLDLEFQKLVKDQMAELAQEKSLLDQKKKDIEKKLDDIKEIIEHNKENDVGEVARLIEMQLEEKDGKVWSEAFQNSSRWADWLLLLKSFEDDSEEESSCSCSDSEKEPEPEPCNHKEERESLENKINEFNIRVQNFKYDLDIYHEESVELGRFFVEFADKYPDNTVTALATDYNKEHQRQVNSMESKVDELQTEKGRYQSKLVQLDEDIKRKNCQCVRG